MNMKASVDLLLPLALAILLPGLNFFSNNDLFNFGELHFYQRWLFASVVLYVLWYVLESTHLVRLRYRWLYMLCSLLALILIAYVLFSWLVIKNVDEFRWNLVIKLVFASAHFIVIQYALRAGRNIARLELEKEQIQSESYRLQLLELRRRVDPHFLFNSLNTLRTMIRNQHIGCERFVMSLSDFYRQTLNYNEESTVTLKEELASLHSFLFLIETRNEGGLDCAISIDRSFQDYLLPTLTLQIVVENCFKHNVMTSASPLRVTISVSDNFYIIVRNKKKPKVTHSGKSGYGLDIIQQRYKLLGIANGVITNDNNDIFEVHLKLI